ncbi:MAG: tetratricopeptide repeat-containing sensor histidine kinase [Bacteroidota bacterium]
MRAGITILLLIVFLRAGHAQNYSIDSLESVLFEAHDSIAKIEILSELSREYIRINPEKSLRYVNRLLKIAEAENSQRGKAHYFRITAAINAIFGYYQLGALLASKANEIYGEVGDSVGISNSYIIMGNNFSRQGLYDSAIAYQTKALHFFKRHNNRAREAVCLSNLSFLYSKKGLYEKGLDVANIGIAMNTRLGNNRLLINDYKNQGDALLNLNRIEEAEQSFLKALEIGQALGEKQDREAMVEANILLGELYKRKKEYGKSVERLNEAISVAEKYWFVNKIIEGYLKLSQVCQLMGNTDLAFKNLVRHSLITDSLLLIQRQDRVRFGSYYSTALVELQKHEALKVANKNQQAIIELQRMRMLMVVVVLGILIVLLYILYLINRRRKAANDALLKLTEELKAANDSKNKFFSIISHDLRSPLHSLKSFTNLLFDHSQSLSAGELQDLASRLRSELDNTMKLSENLIVWSQQQMQKADLKPANIKIRDAVDEILLLYESPLKQKEITVETHIEKEQVWADPNQFSFIVRNLMNNAIKFTPKNGTIFIKSHRHDHGTLIQVSDTGVGIEPDRLRHLFEVSERRHTKGTEGERGSGLGLLLCKEFTQQHQGRLVAESEIGKGTKISVWFPDAR